MRHCKTLFLSLILSVVCIAGSALQSSAFADRQQGKSFFGKAGGAAEDSDFLPNVQLRVQRVSGINVCQTNWGIIGSYGRQFNESAGGCFNPSPDSQPAAPSFEFPKDSGLDYLFCGALWVGARVNGTPYVSVGWEGSSWGFEMWPDGPAPLGSIEELSRIPESSCYSPTALSDQDVFCRYTDTLLIKNMCWDGPFWDYADMRWHRPLGIKVNQITHSWEDEEATHVIICECTITNIGDEALPQVCVGSFVDPEICDSQYPYDSQGCIDDITGFLGRFEVSPGDTEEVNIAWAADNDGWVRCDSGLHWAVPNVIGTKVLSISEPDVELCYNWWSSEGMDSPSDWGPWTAASRDNWSQQNCYAPGDSFFPNHRLGTPRGDCSKYFMMQNGEIDYDQVYSCTWAAQHPEQGWLEPNELCGDFAHGADTKFLLSFGPIHQLPPGASIDFAVAYIIGENFHTDPNNGQNLPENPDSFYAHVDFSDLVHKALLAQRLYDSLLWSPTGVEELAGNVPGDFALSQNFPNPFNTQTRIGYTIPGGHVRSVPVSLRIYNILGQSVRTLVDQPQTGGKHEIIWDGKDDSGRDIASGVYFYRLQAAETVETRRMVLIR